MARFPHAVSCGCSTRLHRIYQQSAPHTHLNECRKCGRANVHGTCFRHRAVLYSHILELDTVLATGTQKIVKLALAGVSDKEVIALASVNSRHSAERAVPINSSQKACFVWQSESTHSIQPLQTDTVAYTKP